MKNTLPIILLLAFAAAVSAEDITLPGNETKIGDPSVILDPNAPSMPGSFFPHDDASGNEVNVSTNVSGHVFGGIAPRDHGWLNADNNTVILTGGNIGTTTTGGNVFGGWTDFGNVNDNTINITGTTAIYGIVFGGWINGGRDNEAKNNTVTINGANVTLRGNVYGAYTQGGSEMTDNAVTITGSSVWKLDAIIAGAYSALNTSTITDNSVTIDGNANVRRGAVYGGRGQGASIIRNNIVTIDGATIGSFGTGSTIYGGHNFNGNGAVGLNEVVIKDGAINAAIYGGASTSGIAHYNTVFIYDGSVTGNIYGGYSTRGIAAGGGVENRAGNRVQIGEEDAAGTPTMPTLDSANLFGGFVASGGGDAFTRNTLNVFTSFTANSAQNFEYIVFYGMDPTLFNVKIGTLDTTPTGSARSGVRLEVLNDNTVNFTGNIIGEGSLTKGGGGTFSISADSSIDIGGALTIERGTLHLQTGNIRTDGSRSEGIITFTGDDGAEIKVDSVSELMGVSFRTAIGAGEHNFIELTGNLEIFYDEDRAFYVERDTTMHVYAREGHIALDVNYADDGLGDLYVAEGGTFNLEIFDKGRVDFYSGIAGEGTLNIYSAVNSGGMVVFSDRFYDYGAEFKMGDIHIEGGTVLALARSEGTPRFAVETNTFTMEGTGTWDNTNYATAMILGGGIIQADSINISKNVELTPDDWNLYDPAIQRTISTMTLRAPTVSLEDFALFYTAAKRNAGTGSTPISQGADGIWTSPNSLLYIDSNNITLSASGSEKNVIAVTTLAGATFEQGDYLLIHTNSTLTGDPNDLFRLEMDRMVVDPDNGTVRGGYSFHLGNKDAPDAGNTSLWLTHELNSLTMVWNTGNDLWGGENFLSAQGGGGGEPHKETNFMSGDFVQFRPTGNTVFYVGLENNVTVSGLEVDGNVTFSGNGGILADIDSAFGQYVNVSLSPTGKLEKRGTTTTGRLRFENTGGNLFIDGVDIYQGTIAINQANQLQVGDGAAINFTGTNLQVTTLEIYDEANVRLDSPINIYNSSTARINVVEKDSLLTLTGDVVSNTTLGTLRQQGEGTLRIVEGRKYMEQGDFWQESGTLAGSGTIGHRVTQIYGNLSPDRIGILPDTPAHPDDRFGTLTLQGNGVEGTIILGYTSNSFSMDFDIDARSKGNDEWKDLLVLQGNGTTTVNDNLPMRGTINFHGALHSDNEYLIIKGEGLNSTAPYYFAGGGINTSLSASLNDVTLDNAPGGSVRGHVDFRLGNDAGTAVSGTNIWLVPSLNSLTMNWQGGDGTWDHGGEYPSDYKFESLQGDTAPVKAHNFQHGDEVAFDTNAKITIEVPDTVYASGLVIGAERINDDIGTPQNGDVTFTGAGSINVDGKSAFGDYKDVTLFATGVLEKHGNGVLSFENEGENNFAGGILLYGGTLQFERANQIQVGTNQQIHFMRSATLKPTSTVQLETPIRIQNYGTAITTATFDVENAEHALILLSMVADDSNIKKTGAGILQLSANSGTVQKTDVEKGTFRVVTGKFSMNNLTVHPDGTLAGSGTININVANIGNGAAGETANGRISPDSAVFTVNKTTIDGDEKFGTLTLVGIGSTPSLTFGEGSVFEVDLARDAAGTLHDLVVVEGATVVNIDPKAILHVTVDYWSGGSENVVIIDAKQGSVGNTEAMFSEFLIDPLPRGVSLEQLGWVGSEFLLGVHYNAEEGFGGLCSQHNRREIGTSLDRFIENYGFGDLHHLITALSEPGLTDEEVCRLLDQITGDLTPNAMMVALKEPWRYPFRRLQFGCPVHGKDHRFWGEFTARYENIGNDNNAHAFTVNRYGIAVGNEQRSHNMISGLTFQYSEPRLRQATGNVRMEDFEIGSYALQRWGDNFEVKSYLGYSHQRYRFDRRVAFLDEQLSGKTSGDTLSLSYEWIRPIRVQSGVWLRPLMALDYEQTWMRGYREQGGESAQIYDKATLARTMLRIGLNGDFNLRNGLSLNGRIQYGTQLNNREHSAHGVRFVNGGTDQYKADIWSSRIGRDYLNLGLGGNWQLDESGSRFVFVNYDAKWYERATMHLGEVGLVRKW